MSIAVVQNENAVPLWRRIGWLTLGEGVARTGQVVSAILLVRFLAPSAWNVIALGLSVYLVAVTIGSLNLEHSILFFLPQLTQHQTNRLLYQTVNLLRISGIVCGAVIVFVQVGTGVLGTMAIALCIACAVACELPTVVMTPIFIARGEEQYGSMWRSGHALIQFFALMVPALCGFGAMGIASGLAVSGFIRLTAFTVVFRRFINGEHVHTPGLLKRQILFCTPLGVALAAGVLTRSMDKWLVAWHEPLMVGIYSIAAFEVPILAVLPYAGGAAIAVSMVTMFHNNEVSDAHSVWWHQARMMSLVVVPLTMGLVVVAPELFEILFSHSYRTSVLPFQIFTLIGLHRVTEYGAVLRAAGRSVEIVYSSLILLGSNLVFGYIGLQIHGLVGLTVGSVLAFLVAWVWILSRLKNVFAVSMRHVFPWSTWTSSVAVSCATAAVAFFLSKGGDSAGPRLVIKLMVMGGVAAALGLIKHRDRKVLPMRGNLLEGNSHA
jgi:O-antigen/teichoic acid export membrane protein